MFKIVLMESLTWNNIELELNWLWRSILNLQNEMFLSIK